MSFREAIAAGLVLIRDALRSPNFVAGVSGWSINQDGTAEFADATIRGELDVVGGSGASITIVPSSQPTLTFHSPDQTNEAFINLITGAGNQAQLGINSGKFTPADLIRRYWRIFAFDNNISMQIVRESTQLTLGAIVQMTSAFLSVGIRDAAGGTSTLLNIGSGTADLSTDVAGTPVEFTNGGRTVPTGNLVNRKASSAQAFTSVETLDSGIGSFLNVPGGTTFTAFAGRTYRVEYVCRGQAQTAGTTMDLRIRDGFDGTAAPPAPTPASTQLAGNSHYLPIAGGAGATGMRVSQTLDCPGDIPAGVHRLGCFYTRTAPAAVNVLVDQAVGQLRELTVDDVGSSS